MNMTVSPQGGGAAPRPVPAAAAALGALLPYIDVHCYATGAETRAALEAFAADRLMSRTSIDIRDGDVESAIARYGASPTPHLIIVECTSSVEETLPAIDGLANVCDANTKVIVVGRANDIGFYRRLIDLGISDYLLAPFDARDLTQAVGRLFCDATAPRLGKVFAFVGAKGGVGSSTVAQNVAWTLAERHEQSVLLADMDLQFGTAAIGCNVQHVRGMEEAIHDVERLDTALLERLMTTRGKRLRLLTTAAEPDLATRFDRAAVEKVIDIAQRNLPIVALDLPHLWTDWIAAAITRADAVVVTAVPTLWGLRSAASLCDAIRRIRPNDPAPILALNKTGAARRAEVSVKEIEAALSLAPTCAIPYSAKLFGTAESKGQMISEIGGAAAITGCYAALADAIADKAAPKRRGLFARFR